MEELLKLWEEFREQEGLYNIVNTGNPATATSSLRDNNFERFMDWLEEKNLTPTK